MKRAWLLKAKHESGVHVHRNYQTKALALGAVQRLSAREWQVLDLKSVLVSGEHWLRRCCPQSLPPSVSNDGAYDQ